MTACAMLLLYFAQLVDPPRLGKLGVTDGGALIAMFFGSTMTATAR
jgi:hypothetical protein